MGILQFLTILEEDSRCNTGFYNPSIMCGYCVRTTEFKYNVWMVTSTYKRFYISRTIWNLNGWECQVLLAINNKNQLKKIIISWQTSSRRATWQMCTGLLYSSANKITAAVCVPSAWVHNGKCLGQCSKCWNVDYYKVLLQITKLF